jgi:tRNA A37 threonylcarbamoyladenosine synthetase subunit TsaC/SUA5/YrdC
MFTILKILKGNLFLISTDTVPGIGGILTEEVKNSILKIKKVDEKKKFAILVSNIQQAREFDE